MAGFGKERAGMCLLHSISNCGKIFLDDRNNGTQSHMAEVLPQHLRNVSGGNAPPSSSGNVPPGWPLASVTRSVQPEPWTIIQPQIRQQHWGQGQGPVTAEEAPVTGWREGVRLTYNLFHLRTLFQ